MRQFLALLGICSAVLAAPAALAEIDGHGPDAWAVTGVAANDTLNMRMGPGTEYLVIGQLAPDARGLRQVTCVPLLLPSIYHRLTEAQRAGLPQRWCLVQTGDFSQAGWVAQRYIMEDGGEAAAPASPPRAGIPLGTIGDPLIDGAARLVRDLYAAFERSNTRASNPFMRPEADRYFFTNVVPQMAGHGSDVLYDSQDFQGEVTRIAPDRDQPMLQGMITINVDLSRQGETDRAVVRLRADTERQGAPMRIFRVEHDGWSYPQ